MDESCCTYERGMSHTCRGLVTNVKELCRKQVVSHRRGYVTLTKKLGFFFFHPYEGDVSHIEKSHEMHMKVSCCAYEGGVSQVSRSHITHMKKESCRTYVSVV